MVVTRPSGSARDERVESESKTVRANKTTGYLGHAGAVSVEDASGLWAEGVSKGMSKGCEHTNSLGQEKKIVKNSVDRREKKFHVLDSAE